MPSQWVDFKSKIPNPENPGIEDVDPKDVAAHQGEVDLVDVRRPNEFDGELGHVPGSRLIVLDTLPQRLDELNKEKTVVFICRSGARSGRAAAFAKENGFTSVYNMKGGMILWNEFGLPVERE